MATVRTAMRTPFLGSSLDTGLLDARADAGESADGLGFPGSRTYTPSQDQFLLGTHLLLLMSSLALGHFSL